MAMPKKGARIITVNGTKFRWRIRRKPTYNQGLANGPMTFSVELAHDSKSVLLVETPHAHSNNFMNEPVVSILPSYVANCIKLALKTGWTPTVQGKLFILSSFTE
ncbi:hypothetical protein BGP_0480 [Beggiatoa sp. PS]|nr:hypothetical protein BGP_0480 [Beggiatoa sp. PS]